MFIGELFVWIRDGFLWSRSSNSDAMRGRSTSAPRCRGIFLMKISLNLLFLFYQILYYSLLRICLFQGLCYMVRRPPFITQHRHFGPPEKPPDNSSRVLLQYWINAPPTTDGCLQYYFLKPNIIPRGVIKSMSIATTTSVCTCRRRCPLSASIFLFRLLSWSTTWRI